MWTPLQTHKGDNFSPPEHRDRTLGITRDFDLQIL